MNKNAKKEIENKMLNDDQSMAVKQAIISSMRDVYVNAGTLPDPGFDSAALTIAEKIIKNAQMSLMQSSVYEKVINSTKPLKAVKKNKNARR